MTISTVERERNQTANPTPTPGPLGAHPVGTGLGAATFDDSVLTSKVKIALIDDPVTKAGQINVGTEKGVVQLTGFVDSTAMKTRAGDVARSVDGVKSVRNDHEIRQK